MHDQSSQETPRTYTETTARIAALIDGETDEIALMSTIVCELYHSFDGFDWVGFYRVRAHDTLKIGPYQGGHGCLTIDFSRGVCGACARTGEVQIVDDVEAFPDHIACSASTRSEIVLPVYRNSKLIGVLDIDSDQPSFFDHADREALSVILVLAFGDQSAPS